MNPHSGKPRPTSHTVLRILTGILLLSMSALPVTTIISETGKLQELLEGIQKLENFFGNQISAWLLVGFLTCVPLLGLYLITEPVVLRFTRR